MREQKQLPEYTNQAKKFMDDLNKKAQQRLRKAIEKIPRGDIIPFKSKPGHFRLRVGNYRVIYKWISDCQILIFIIDNRGDIY